MGEMTTDKNELMRRWMKLYLNLMILRSKVSYERKLLEEMKEKMGEMNEYMMDFFDGIGANPEAEG